MITQRYFIIETKYSDPDTFCHFIVGSDRVRASIQIYADRCILDEVATALLAPSLKEETARPFFVDYKDDDDLFHFFLTVLPHEGKNRCLRFCIFQGFLDDSAPFRADIRFNLTPEEAEELANDLKAWCANPVYQFVWKED